MVGFGAELLRLQLQGPMHAQHPTCTCLEVDYGQEDERSISGPESVVPMSCSQWPMMLKGTVAVGPTYQSVISPNPNSNAHFLSPSLSPHPSVECLPSKDVAVMHSPTGILSLSQVTEGAGTPVTSQVRTRGFPANWLRVSVLGFSNTGATAEEKPDSHNVRTPSHFCLLRQVKDTQEPSPDKMRSGHNDLHHWCRHRLFYSQM